MCDCFLYYEMQMLTVPNPFILVFPFFSSNPESYRPYFTKKNQGVRKLV